MSKTMPQIKRLVIDNWTKYGDVMFFGDIPASKRCVMEYSGNVLIARSSPAQLQLLSIELSKKKVDHQIIYT